VGTKGPCQERDHRMATPREMEDGVTIRSASIADIPALVRLRREMFEAMGFEDATTLDASDSACGRYFHEAMGAGSFRAWVAVTADGTVVASGGLVIDCHPPGPDNLGGQTGYLMSLSTARAFRRRGLATRIMRAMLAALRESGIPAAALHATDAGRPLYAALGFRDSNEMRLSLPVTGRAGAGRGNHGSAPR